MPRKRLIQSLLLIAGLAVVSYALIGLYLPSSRRIILGVDRKTGAVRMVRHHITFLPPFRYFRLRLEQRSGAAQSDGIVHLASRDGVPVSLAWRLRFEVSGDHLAGASRLIRDGWARWIEARIAAAAGAIVSQVGIDDLLSPTSQFNSDRGALREAVSRHLAESGLKVTAFAVASIDADREVMFRVKEKELRSDPRTAPTHVAIFGLDGADWDLLSDLSEKGRIPNIRSLIRAGTTASIPVPQPAVTPALWTTAVTGLAPDRHGVRGFSDETHHNAVVESYARRTPALWEIVAAFGRSGLVANWWTAWPPVAGPTIVCGEPVATVPDAVYPPDLAPRAQSMQVAPSTVNFPQINRFLNLLPAEWDHAIAGGDPRDSINLFRATLARSWSNHDIAMALYADERRAGHDPLLIMLYEDGTDAVNHLFGPFRPPERDGVNPDDYRRFSPAVDNYYSEVDRLIGEWIKVLPRDTTIIIMSAYGFRWGSDRPKSPPNGAAALSDHSGTGVFIASGPHVIPSRASHIMSLRDLAPTVLTLLGLPKSNEMTGETPAWLLRDLSPITSVRIETYGELLAIRPVATRAHIDPTVYRRNLEAIGHIGGLPPFDSGTLPASSSLSAERWGACAYYNNLGVELRGKNRIQEAVGAFQQAVAINPDHPVAYLNLAVTLFDDMRYDAADDALLHAAAQGLPNAESRLTDFAALYRQHGLVAHAVALLQGGKDLFPGSHVIAANLGSALLAAGRDREGAGELERALALGPSSPEVLDNLGTYFARKKEWERALSFWNRSLIVDPHQPQIRQAAEGARARL